MLAKFIADYSLEKVVAIEESDRQFLALKSAWEAVKNCKYNGVNNEQVDTVFLLAVIYNSLISYQIAGSGELRWEEFSQNLESDFDVLMSDFLQGKASYDWWYNLMITSKYNKRLYNIKLRRLKKLKDFPLNTMRKYYENMDNLWLDLAMLLSVDPGSKTVVFAVKMFGYVARLIYGFIPYPMSIPIPVDSRIRRIFIEKYGNLSDKEIILEANRLAKISGIAPLHLDSLFWVKR